MGADRGLKRVFVWRPPIRALMLAWLIGTMMMAWPSATAIAQAADLAEPEASSGGSDACTAATDPDRGSLERPVPDPLFAIVGDVDLGQDVRAIRLSESTVEMYESGRKLREIPRVARRPFDLDEIATLVDDPTWLSEVEPGVYELRAALVQSQGTLLRISVPVVSELRLVDLPGVMVIGSRADLLVSRSRIKSWDPAIGGPDQNPQDGRPFIYYKNRSRVDILESEIVALGSNRALSHGVSLRLGDTTGTIVDSTFVQNWIGLFTAGTADVNVEGSVFESNIVHGVQAHEASTGLVIRDSELRCNGVHGVLLTGASDSTLHDNTFERNGEVAVAVDGSTATDLVANTVTGHGVGIRLNGERTEGVTVTGNRIVDNDVGLQSGAAVRSLSLDNNRLEGNHLVGLILSSTGVTMSQDRVVGSPRALDIGGTVLARNVRLEALSTAVMVRDGLATFESAELISEERGVVTIDGGAATLADSEVRAPRPVSGAVMLGSTNLVDGTLPVINLLLAPVILAAVVGAAYAAARLHRHLLLTSAQSVV